MTKFSLTARLKAFGHAWRGIIKAWTTEHNIWIHTVATVLVVISGLVLQVGRGDWMVLIIAITLVMAAELFNSSIEYLADALHPERALGIQHAKDIAAGAVLISSIGAALLGILVFFPHIVQFWNTPN